MSLSLFSNLFVWASFSGIAFAIYPIMLMRTGLSGNANTAAWCLLTFIGAALCVIMEGGTSFNGINWLYLVGAGVVGVLALILLNGMFSRVWTLSIPVEVRTAKSAQLFMVMLISQVAVVGAWKMWAAGGFSLRDLAGYVAATIAIHLLVNR